MLQRLSAAGVFWEGPSGRSRDWLASNRSCRKGFKWNGVSKGLGAGTGFVEKLGGSWLGRQVEDKVENIG